MRKYRLLCADPKSKHMKPVGEFFAVDDEEASRLAGLWRDGRAAELWRAYSVVKRWGAS